MASDVPPVGAGADPELTRLFLSSLDRGYASDEGEPFYTRTVLGDQSAEAGTLGTIVAYSAAYPPEGSGLQLLSYVVCGQEDQAHSQDQLIAILLGHGDPYIPKHQSVVQLNLNALQPVFDRACSLAAPWHLPALAVLHVVTKDGRGHVEFVAPRAVKSSSLISYMHMRFVAGLE